MDRLRWDSEVYEEYLTDLQRMNRCLTTQIQRLTQARKNLMSQGVTVEDKALHEILNRLEKQLKKLNTTSDRIHQLTDALEMNMDIFRNAEKRIGDLGTDLLYRGVMNGTVRPVLVMPYSNPFTGREITPDWLSRMAGVNIPESVF